jgi:hypothetical protein
MTTAGWYEGEAGDELRHEDRRQAFLGPRITRSGPNVTSSGVLEMPVVGHENDVGARRDADDRHQTVQRSEWEHAKAPAAAGSVVLFRADPPRIGYADPEARRLMRELARRLQDAPVIERAAAANTSLLAGGSFARPLTIQADVRLVTDGSVYGLRVTPEFFSTLGIRVIAGRDFEERDTRGAEPGSLAVVGLYGVMSFVVTRRTPEIGVRLALGSTRAAAVWLVIRDAVVMIGAGTAVALPCVWALGRLVEAELFGVSAVDGPTIALASALLALVALAAAMSAAWRAASISPTQALRVE